MSLNGSGVYLVNSAGQPVVADTLITSAAFNAFTADIAAALSTAVFKDGQQTITANIPMGGYRFTGLGAGASNGQSLRYEQLFTTSGVQLLGAMDWVKGADIASAATVNLTTATGNGVHITGTTTITAVTLGSGMWRLVIFDDALTLTHHATNNNLPTGANITTAAGDRALYWADGTTTYCAIYMPAAGYAGLGANTFTGTQTIESTDAGASVGPVLDLYRNSASPAASDLLGEILFNGKDDAGNKTSYADIIARIDDPANTSEDGRLIFRTIVAGTFTNQLNMTAGLFANSATGGAQGTGTINMVGVYKDGAAIQPRVVGAAVATTSGTSVTLTSVVPTWATKITLGFVGVSTAGTGAILIQVGPTSGVVGSGYLGAGSRILNGANPVTANQTAGLAISGDNADAAVYHGIGTLTLQNSSTNTWAWSFTGARSDTTSTCNAAGSISLSGALEDIVITNVAADAFDAGSVNVSWE